MLYLVDANVLIDAERDYYPISMVPEFWGWLQYQGGLGTVKVPIEILEEICEGKGALVDWLGGTEVKKQLVLPEDSEPSEVSQIVESGYAKDLTDEEVARIGRDPFLVAYALRTRSERVVVTTESSKPSKIRANRHLPDVCESLGVKCCNTFAMLRALDFRTRWR